MSIVRGAVHPKNIYEWLEYIHPLVHCFVREPTIDLFLHWLSHRLRGSACAYGWAHVLTERTRSQ